MTPPWIKFPNIPYKSIGWRMGDAELYMADFGKWYIRLQPSQRKRFLILNPQPNEWIEYFDNLNRYVGLRNR
jgi:hypothetical protein